jgi:uncharacterized protein YkwD
VLPPRSVSLAVATALASALLGAGSAALGATGHTQHSASCASFRVGHHGRPAPGCHSSSSPNGHRHRGCAHALLRPSATNILEIREATFCLINRERAAHDESQLHPNARLHRAAQAHTESMASHDYFEHFGPRGQTPLARILAAGYISSRRAGYEVGENIAWGTQYLATPSAIVAAWMASPGHRANILDRRFRDTGIGVSPRPPSSLANGQPGAIYTQDFGVIIG